MLSELLADLFESLPDNAYPGESNAEVLLEMLVGTIRPVAEAAGSQSVMSATALIVDSRDKTLSHLRRVVQLARHRDAGQARRMGRRSRRP